MSDKISAHAQTRGYGPRVVVVAGLVTLWAVSAWGQGPAPNRGVWFFDDKRPDGTFDTYASSRIIGNPQAEDRVLAMFDQLGVKRVYTSLNDVNLSGDFDAPGKVSNGDLRAWNHRLHNRGIESHLLLSESSWIFNGKPSTSISEPLISVSGRAGLRALDDERSKLLGLVQNRLIDFNHGAPSQSQRYDGLHLDLEPWTLTFVGQDGDTGYDGSVTFGDFAVAQLNFGDVIFNGRRGGDFTRDGRVTFSDFSLLQLNFGDTFLDSTVGVDGWVNPRPGDVDPFEIVPAVSEGLRQQVRRDYLTLLRDTYQEVADLIHGRAGPPPALGSNDQPLKFHADLAALIGDLTAPTPAPGSAPGVAPAPGVDPDDLTQWWQPANGDLGAGDRDAWYRALAGANSGMGISDPLLTGLTIMAFEIDEFALPGAIEARVGDELDLFNAVAGFDRRIGLEAIIAGITDGGDPDSATWESFAEFLDAIELVEAMFDGQISGVDLQSFNLVAIAGEAAGFFDSPLALSDLTQTQRGQISVPEPAVGLWLGLTWLGWALTRAWRPAGSAASRRGFLEVA